MAVSSTFVTWEHFFLVVCTILMFCNKDQAAWFGLAWFGLIS